MSNVQAQPLDNVTSEDILNEDSVKSFSDLSKEISNAKDGDVIHISENYKYNSQVDQSITDGIRISKNITVEGDSNSYIDGSNLMRGFLIDSNCNVVFNNVTIINCYSEDSGGAVYLSEKSNLVLHNCVFKNNKVYNSNGGAIYCHLTTNLTSYDSIFENNSAIRESDAEWQDFKAGMGSAICVYLDSNLKLYNSNFTKNNAYLTTILVVSFSNSTNKLSTLHVEKCLFENNTAFSSGAIYLDELGKGEILDSTFRNNVASDKGATVILDASLSALVKNCVFENNYGATGGAIRVKVFEDQYRSNVVISDCNFTKNTASIEGGALYSKYGLTEVFNCRFIDNHAIEKGGAIFSKEGSVKVSGSYFENNSAEYGGALFIRSDNSVVNTSKFFENSASKKGGAVYSIIQTIDSVDCEYVSNSAPEAPDVYGAYMVNVDHEITYFDQVKMVLKLFSPWGMPLSQDVRVRLEGDKSYKSKIYKTDSNGVLTLTLPFSVDVGQYKVSVSMYNGVAYTNPETINIIQSPSKIAISPLTTTYASERLLKFYVKNSKTNNPVSDAKVKVYVYTGKSYVTYTGVSNEKGLVTIDVSKNGVGKHKVVVKAGNNNIKLSKTKSWVKINKASAKVVAPKKVKRPSKLSVTVKNKASGNVIKKTNFNLRIYTGSYFKSYVVKTNSKGIFKISTKKLSKGTHKMQIILNNANYDINKKFSVKIK